MTVVKGFLLSVMVSFLFPRMGLLVESLLLRLGGDGSEACAWVEGAMFMSKSSSSSSSVRMKVGFLTLLPFPPGLDEDEIPGSPLEDELYSGSVVTSVNVG